MNTYSKISIVIPVFNGQKFIRDCMESVINQTYTNIEVIVVDDGSTDNTEKLVQDFKSKDERIYYYKQTNQGVSSARNSGILRCTGEFICFVDSDDLVEIDFCETMMEAVDDYTDAVICGMKVTYKNQVTLQIPKTSSITGAEACMNILEGKYNTGFICNKLLRVSVLRKNSLLFSVGYIYEDLLLSYMYCKHANIINYVDKALYCYRRRANSLCTNYNEPRRMKDLIVIIKTIEMLVPRDRKSMKSFILFLYDSLLRLNNYYMRSSYENNYEIFFESATYIISRVTEIKKEYNI